MSQQPPNDFFPNACPGLGGAKIHFNNPCAWAHGQAQLTNAHFTGLCKGATRTIHWHSFADEWGFVKKGKLMTFVASPDGLPWPSSTNVLDPKGVWYFPSGWLHGLLCTTPESEGGCEFYIVFASPQAAEPNGHNLDTTLAQAPDDLAAHTLQMSVEQYHKMRPNFGRSAVASNLTAPIVTMVGPKACEPECPKVQETVAAPAAMQASAVEQTKQLEKGVVLHQIRTANFPFARTMSQERTELAPGATRPIVWASADAMLLVVSGTITVGLEGGVLGAEAHLAFGNETISEGDSFYFPNGRAYWFQESTGKAHAETITVFNVGQWKNFEMRQSLSEMPEINVYSNLHSNDMLAQEAGPVHIHI
eukprot:gnl/MRDRNA2_/MRDRNA2_117357_c0_seq1.p1 gnl/MRDRNA2_/MRDRNA2_117357_c0~~gnl/MRDRNA2_/MRDRNA2_117357_c0_seq1.p1  ORF type:complete len:425 (+),score=63.10 gnl/MRDRNA2_/MRDRNA2_117357_c0_seq1:188-1276(+)